MPVFHLYALPLHSQTIGFDPIISASEAAEFNTRWMTLDELWPLADYITVHTPLIPQTTSKTISDMFTCNSVL